MCRVVPTEMGYLLFCDPVTAVLCLFVLCCAVQHCFGLLQVMWADTAHGHVG